MFLGGFQVRGGVVLRRKQRWPLVFQAHLVLDGRVGGTWFDSAFVFYVALRKRVLFGVLLLCSVCSKFLFFFFFSGPRALIPPLFFLAFTNKI